MRSTENTDDIEAEITDDGELYTRASKRALYLLGGKDYGTRELYDKLAANYPPSVCDKVIARMRDYGYLDDERYAKKLARSQIIVKKHGRQRALIEMVRKGLPRELCESALDEYDKEDIQTEIAELVRKKYADKIDRGNPDWHYEQQKAIAALARRGYGYGDIKTAIETVLNEYQEDNED